MRFPTSRLALFASRLVAPLAVGLLLAVIALPAFAVDEAALVKKLVDRYAAAREGEDLKALADLFTDDADQLVSSGEWRKGREALVNGMLASSRTNPGDRTITVETVAFPRDGVAIANARYEIAASADRPARQMWSTFVCVRGDGGWRIAAIRNMLPAK